MFTARSVRITEKHYASWVQARQEILKAHVAKMWQAFGVIEGGKATAKQPHAERASDHGEC